MQCAAAARPQGRARAPVRLQPRSRGPGHRGERRRAASTLPAQRRPAAFASPFPPACLQMTIAKTGRVSRAGKTRYFSLCGCVSGYLEVSCSPQPPHAHPDALWLWHTGLWTECSSRFPVVGRQHASRCISLHREQSSSVKRHLGAGDEQSATSETPPTHAQLSGEGTPQEAVGDEAERSLAELVDASGGGETRKRQL